MKFAVLILGIAASAWAQIPLAREHAMPALNQFGTVFREETVAPAHPPALHSKLNAGWEVGRRASLCFTPASSESSPANAELSARETLQAWDLLQSPRCLLFSRPSEGPGLRSMSFGDLGRTPALPPSIFRAADSLHLAEGQRGDDVSWTPLARQSLSYLAIMHTFRIATEPSTRIALKNPVAGGYFKALGAMHGWSDGDTYYENYLGHPIEGAVSSYLWIHNDPRYRKVEFGRSRDYWMSRLRAYAFAWAFSEQFEIGLLSEASIGQIQRYCCAYGFVDHVVTPNGGMVWLIGGDIIDKYVTRRIEDHTRNPVIRAIARAGLNPPLSFANFISGQYPWHRENRPGVRDYDGESYLSGIEPQRRDIQRIPTFELTATLPSVLRFDGLSCVGGGGVGAIRLTDSWQWSAEVSGCTLGNFEKNWSGDSLIFNTGPQWIFHNSGRWSPHFAMRLGGQKVTQQHVDPVLKQQVLDSLPPGKRVKDVSHEYTTHLEATGLSLVISGGADLRLNPALALRVANIDYVRSWLDSINGYNLNHGYRVSTGLVLRLGTW